MQNHTTVQVKGLGVPVQSPNNKISEGFELRWSSDPDVPANARVHLFSSKKEIDRFLRLAIDERFLKSDLITIIPVSAPDGTNSLSREEAIRAGIHPDNWDLIRVALVISGNNERGPVMDEIEWVGSREQHNEGVHMQEAFEHANRRKITQPAIFQHNQCGHLLRAAEFMSMFQRKMKPTLNAAIRMDEALEERLLMLDTSKINGDSAIHYLHQLQQAVANLKTVNQLNYAASLSTGVATDPAPSGNDAAEAPEDRRQQGPRFH